MIRIALCGALATLAALITGACGHAASVTEPAPPPPAKSVQLNAPGANVDLDAALLPGYVTVVDFWAEHCGACVVVGGMLAVGVAQQDRVLIRKIDVGDGFSAVAKAYSIGALPHYRVYDKHKRLRYDLVGNDCLKASEIAAQLAAE
ncbi:MAG: thioredoxin family protein [Deltaproteobacteria bacterium]|nr:thioredoxin family protein [Deltaproteobacteria bacterium]MDQ3301336.1 thioredoxin family protein [Myxococcota bacterium]